MKFGEQQPEELNNAEKKENMPWVQDVVKEEADKMIEEMNVKIETGEIKSPEGSKYEAGQSKSGNENEVGIYFSDPTASKENMVTGKELEGRKMAEIGTADITIYKEYFADKGIKYEIYTYKDNTELSLLVLDSFALQKQIFDELVDGNEEIKGGFGSDITVKEEAELELVHE